jgi:hypothetical protein
MREARAHLWQQLLHQRIELLGGSVAGRQKFSRGTTLALPAAGTSTTISAHQNPD